MRSGSSDFDYFLESKLTKLAHCVQFRRMLMFCLEDWGTWALCPPWLRHWHRRAAIADGNNT